MRDKILETLKGAREQNSQVSDRTLEGLADQYSKLITTDEQLEAMDAKGLLENLQGNINFVLKGESDKLLAKHQKELENLKAQQKVEPKKEPEPPDNDAVKTLQEQIQQIANQMKDLQEGAIKEGRLAKIQKAYAGMPKAQVDVELSLYESVYAGMSTDVFNSMIEQKTEANKAFVDSVKAKGLDFTVPSRAQAQDDDGQTPVLKKAREMVNKQNKEK